MNFNFRIPEDPDARIVFYNRCCICIICVIVGILCGRYFYGRRNPQVVKQPESPIITEEPKQPEPTSTPTPEASPEPIPTPTPEVSPEPPIKPLPKENPPTVELPENLSDELRSCLKYGGGGACFADQYQPKIPEPSHPPQPTHPKQLPPILPDLPDYPSDNDSDVNNIAIAVISGREVKDWTPDYNLPPMSTGVCPPSWVIAYQERLFCNRRLILQPSQPIRRFDRYRYR